MEDNVWRDPLLITDACTQQYQELNFRDSLNQPRNSMMVDPDDIFRNPIQEISWKNESLVEIEQEDFSSPADEILINGREMLGFSLATPDLVICAGSPDIPPQSFTDSLQFLKGRSTVASLENGIIGSENSGLETPKFADQSTLFQGCKEECVSQEVDFELPPPPISEEVSPPERTRPLLNINVGSTDDIFSSGGITFSEDKHFSGGDITRTESAVGDEEDVNLYQSARFGNFTYNFNAMRPGLYIVDLHFAEIVFTDGPSGMRVFDVFIQEQKVVSSLDIFASVGGNQPLVISNIKTKVEGEEGLFIRLEGLVGKPILCGICVRQDFSHGYGEADLAPAMGVVGMEQGSSLKDDCPSAEDQDFCGTQTQFESKNRELLETKQALLELRKENELKQRECQEVWRSLTELQNELMRKSMHVGSLAFAIEGQVKEKSRWFSSLRDMKRKLKLLKMDQMEIAEEASSFKADVNDMVSQIQSKMEEQSENYEDLKAKYIKSSKERKELYNKILELKGNIRVFCRCRPLNAVEVAAKSSMAIDFDAAREGELTVLSNGLSKKTFRFDAVFSPRAGQVDVFEDTAPVATSVLDGYNVSIFAFGQTGTGKTFTMEGTEEARGVNYRTLEALFRIMEERQSIFRYEISVSVLEVYNEQIRDLLVSDSGAGAKRLEIKQVGEGMHPVPGLVEAPVKNMKEVWEVLRTGSDGRAVGSTGANEHSSRSHCIHCVMVKGENLLNGECTRSKLWLIDLAGSERIAKTEVQGERLKETQNINKSLSALGDVISALATKSPHIPFRNSKLTHLLQDSLGGDSKTLMFVQISPNENDISETLCSLNFASRVRGIELGPAKKQLENNELLRCKQTVEKTKQEVKNRDFQIKKLEDTVQGLDIKIKEKDVKNKNLQDKIKELESQLLIERKLARQHDDNKTAEQHLEMKQNQHKDQHSAVLSRPPLATKTNSFLRTIFDKDQQTNIHLPVPGGVSKQNELVMEKENNPEVAELFPLPKRAGRASMCPLMQKCPVQLPRRSSLIPTSLPLISKVHSTVLPFTPSQDNNSIEDHGVQPPILMDSPKEHRVGSKKLSSVIRKSMHKKIQMKSPMQQQPPMRRVGVNVGMEKVRVSIGSRGRMAHRVVGNARRALKDTHQYPNSRREKERGWNIATAARAIS